MLTPGLICRRTLLQDILRARVTLRPNWPERKRKRLHGVFPFAFLLPWILLAYSVLVLDLPLGYLAWGIPCTGQGVRQRSVTYSESLKIDREDQFRKSTNSSNAFLAAMQRAKCKVSPSSRESKKHNEEKHKTYTSHRPGYKVMIKS